MTGRFSIEDRAPLPYVGLTRTVTLPTISEIADRIPDIIGALSGRGDEIAGAPFLRYLVIDMENELSVEAGVPVAEGVSAPADCHAGVLPGGRYVTTTHVGTPDGIQDTTAELLRWADAEGVVLDHDGDTWACRTESFESDPRVVPAQEQRTVVSIRLAD